jgi:two-component system chemotaxis response regulator CheB
LSRFFLKNDMGRGDVSFSVRPELRRLVTFQRLNLLEPNWGVRGPLDVLFCRNIMIYFDKPTQYKILKRFVPLMDDNGLLFAGHSESFLFASDLFHLQGDTVYELANKTRSTKAEHELADKTGVVKTVHELANKARSVKTVQELANKARSAETVHESANKARSVKTVHELADKARRVETVHESANKARRVETVHESANKARVVKTVQESADKKRGVSKTPMPETVGRSSITSRIIFVGASTGGTEAIKNFLLGFPVDCPPTLIVQHMPESFTGSFAMRLNGLCQPRVIEARGGEILAPGVVYLSPGHSHMRVRRSGTGYATELLKTQPVNRHRPSVDVLFDSAAEVVGHRAVGVILTGMGKDGANGLLRMRQGGARTFGQDEASCVVYGMPREAVLIGAVEEVDNLEALAQKALAAAHTV